MKRQNLFAGFARAAARASSHPRAFQVALMVVLVWGATGPLFGFSDTWQLVINTGTAIVTFLMVFLIQHSQDRDTTAMQIKLDELIRSVQGAHNALLDLEELDSKALERIRDNYRKLAELARQGQAKGHPDTTCPEIAIEPAPMQSELSKG